MIVASGYPLPWFHDQQPGAGCLEISVLIVQKLWYSFYPYPQDNSSG
jgi:hypothetical protein